MVCVPAVCVSGGQALLAQAVKRASPANARPPSACTEARKAHAEATRAEAHDGLLLLRGRRGAHHRPSAA
eukprot:5956538-Prymnesium_polylepis.1